MSLMQKVVLSMCLFIVCESKKSGAPSEACNDMRPHHRNSEPQDSPSPFILAISASVATLNSISVKLSHPNSDTFRGFLIQARLFTDKEKILDGTFSSNEEYSREATCDGIGTYLTHTNNSEKTSVETTWTPPAGFEGEVVFRATVVKEYSIFWVGIESEPIFAKSSENITTMTPMDDIYKECGETKGCFGFPNGCVAKSDCTLILAYVPEDNFIQFELIGAIKNKDNGWIAMGISNDAKMGDDSVTECTHDKGKYTLKQSWNTLKPLKNIQISNPQGSIIEKIHHQYADGIFSCNWTQKYETFVKQHKFDLKNEHYYILIATGPMLNGAKDKHGSRLPSSSKIDLTKIALIQGKSSLLVKIHGSFMVAAWLALVSIGILLARYYKQVWEGSTLCKTKIWFAFHRAIMFLAVGLIIAAFVAIFIYEDGWSEAYPHSILGCITTGLSIIQVIVGLARPDPKSSKRPAFNWLHWLNGNCSQILAIITIFFAIQLKEANLPRYCYWILIGYIAFHLVFHLTLQFHSCCMEKKADTNEIKLHQLGQKREVEAVRDAPGGGFRRFMLGIYVVVSFAIVTALVLIICLD